MTGTGFVGASAVDFASTPAFSFVLNSPTEITAIAPAMGAAIVDVTVTTPAGTSAAVPADRFTFGARITGTVTDANDPSGLAGVCVSVTSSAGTGQAVTAGDGTYSISGFPAGSYTVKFDPTCGGTVSTPDETQWYLDAPIQSDATLVVMASSETASFIDAELFSTAGAAPGSATDVAAVAGDASAKVSWTDPENNGSAITAYSVIAVDLTTPTNGGETCTALGARATSCTVSGLTNGDRYTFNVSATNGVGTGVASSSSNTVTPMGTPGAPTGLSATTSLVVTSATLSWTAPSSDGGSPITGYLVSASGYGGQACTTSGATSCVVTGLVNGANYTFTVVATNAMGVGPASSASNEVTVGRWTTVSLGFKSPTASYGDEQADLFSVSVSLTWATGRPVPTGTVSLVAGSKTLCVVKLVSGRGVCALSAKELAIGSYDVVATYSGSALYMSATERKD